MNPETAHKVTLWGLRLAEKMRVLPLVMGEVPSDPVEILGMKFPTGWDLPPEWTRKRIR